MELNSKYLLMIRFKSRYVPDIDLNFNSNRPQNGFSYAINKNKVIAKKNYLKDKGNEI